MILPESSLLRRARSSPSSLLGMFPENCEMAIAKTNLAAVNVCRFELRQRLRPKPLAITALKIGELNDRLAAHLRTPTLALFLVRPEPRLPIYSGRLPVTDGETETGSTQ